MYNVAHLHEMPIQVGKPTKGGMLFKARIYLVISQEKKVIMAPRPLSLIP